MLRCDGCGADAEAGAGDPFPFRCPNADSGDGADHVLAPTPSDAPFPRDPVANPLLAYTGRLHFGGLGLDELDLFALVQGLDARVAAVDGHGFVATPFARDAALSEATGCELWVKDETGNVGGSHKARHLVGILLHLEAARRLGWREPTGPLAIASCGNAALAAAVLARAADRPLTVFIPPRAAESVVARLEALGANIVRCERRVGEPGDPCYHRFREAVAAGAIPFCCQGTDNGLCLDAGRTLAYEMASQAGGQPLDHVFLQVGGGAFASSTARALRELVDARVLSRMPRIHAVQTGGAFPLVRAWARVMERAGDLDHAAKHRAEYMWPWEAEPRSVADGILDDETYDWLGVLRGVVDSGGTALTVDEETLSAANTLAAGSAPVSHTGSAGLAGVLAARPTGRVAVVFSGVRR